MDIFETQADVEVQEEKDTLGGFVAKETDLYEGVVKTAFLEEAKSGSWMLKVLFELKDEKGKPFSYTEQECVWSAKTKGDFYIDTKTGKKRQLIGKAKMDSLCKLLTGEDLKTQSAKLEDKYHAVRKDGKEVEEQRKTFTEWNGIDVYVGLQKVSTNAQVKQGTKYVNTAERKDENQINKIFDGSKRTLIEQQEDAKPEFADKWVKANKGKTRDLYKEVKAAAGVPSAAPAATLDLG